jgi:hypothetical protein
MSELSDDVSSCECCLSAVVKRRSHVNLISCVVSARQPEATQVQCDVAAYTLGTATPLGSRQQETSNMIQGDSFGADPEYYKLSTNLPVETKHGEYIPQ